MSAIDRCTCTPHYQDAGAGLTEYVPEWDPSCSEHGEVGHIIESGVYFDRRGRQWDYIDTAAAWSTPEIDHEGIPWGGVWIDTSQMRLLIERDQHRDECPGLRWCLTHPVVNVGRNRLSKSWQVWGPGDWYRTSLGAFPEAMDAARALAVAA